MEARPSLNATDCIPSCIAACRLQPRTGCCVLLELWSAWVPRLEVPFQPVTVAGAASWQATQSRTRCRLWNSLGLTQRVTCQGRGQPEDQDGCTNSIHILKLRSQVLVLQLPEPWNSPSAPEPGHCMVSNSQCWLDVEPETHLIPNSCCTHCVCGTVTEANMGQVDTSVPRVKKEGGNRLPVLRGIRN